MRTTVEFILFIQISDIKKLLLVSHILQSREKGRITPRTFWNREKNPSFSSRVKNFSIMAILISRSVLLLLWDLIKHNPAGASTLKNPSTHQCIIYKIISTYPNLCDIIIFLNAFFICSNSFVLIIKHPSEILNETRVYARRREFSNSKKRINSIHIKR